MIDAIGFDLDGTLWNSVAQVTQAYNIIRDQEGLPHVTEAQVSGIMGKLFEGVAADLNPGLPEEQSLALHREECDFENQYLLEHPGTLYPGVTETLQHLAKDYKLFLVSNCQDGYELPFLNLPGLEGLFCDRETAGRTGLSKAENIRLVCARQGFHRPLYVGDTAGDMAAAREAGVPFVHAAYGFGTVPEGTPAIHSISELIQYVKEID